MQFYWELVGDKWEFRIKNSSALLMKMKSLEANQWECTCLHNSIVFQCEGVETAKIEAQLWVTQVITNVLITLERHNVR